MSIYDEMRVVAAELFAEFGQGVVQYVHVTPGGGPAYNPGAGSENPVTIDATTRGVDQKYVDGTNIVASDLQASMPATLADKLGAEPNVSGFVSLDGKRYKLIEVKRVPPSGTAIVYHLIFRK